MKCGTLLLASDPELVKSNPGRSESCPSSRLTFQNHLGAPGCNFVHVPVLIRPANPVTLGQKSRLSDGAGRDDRQSGTTLWRTPNAPGSPAVYRSIRHCDVIPVMLSLDWGGRLPREHLVRAVRDLLTTKFP